MTDVERIGVLATEGWSTEMVLRALSTQFPQAHVRVLYERPISRAHLLRRRASKLGIRVALGQAAFVKLLYPLLARLGAKRRRAIEAEIIASYPGSGAPPPDEIEVPSVNSSVARAALIAFDPQVVLVSGTRIIGAKTLKAVDAPFINMHAGITPAYRGVHGGYWALFEGRPDLVGTTIHLVDTGIDTGEVLAQVHFRPTQQDSFATCPALHVQAGLPALMAAVEAALAERLQTTKGPDLPTQLRYHPTLATYLRGCIMRGVC